MRDWHVTVASRDVGVLLMTLNQRSKLQNCLYLTVNCLTGMENELGNPCPSSLVGFCCIEIETVAFYLIGLALAFPISPPVPSSPAGFLSRGVESSSIQLVAPHDLFGTAEIFEFLNDDFKLGIP
ncbi:hypothetical protein SAY86_018572 [Trapa natans]|uniref:Uncharacterized protein n=1 Tax=Trapa natans TaxID=22666 RepID=A0AAN7QY69_TRANT|nr:hypothetical protein SAY86_018572 [Trapa natans]